MEKLKYLFALILRKLKNDDEVLCRYFRKMGMSVGENCHIYSNLTTSESYLISIGDNVTVSNGVQFITHDNSICKVLPEYTDTFGYISIGSNSFIGAKSVILRGVTIPDYTIIGAGSVVTHSFYNENTIIAGNPAKEIGNWDNYKKKYSNVGINISSLSNGEKRKQILLSSDRLKELR